MLTIRKKLAEQASSSNAPSLTPERGKSTERGVKRRMSFRSQLLTDGEIQIAVYMYL